MNLWARIKRREKLNGGYAAVTMVILVLAASLTIISSFSFFALNEVKVNRAFTKSIEARYVAESGVEDATYRLITGKQLGSSETLTVGNGITTITYIQNGLEQFIKSSGLRDAFQQNIETKILGSSGTGSDAHFYYGVQVGAGGVLMENTSQIQGSVYSNGPVVGPSSGSAVHITGDAFAAGTSAIEHIIIDGNARANYLSDLAVENGTASSTTDIDGGSYKYAYANQVIGINVILDAHANTIIDSNVERSCYFQTILGSSCLNEFPNNPITPPANLPTLAMPIPDSQLDQWETDAAAGGTQTGPCEYGTGDVVTIGPKKFDCGELEIKGSAVVTIAGPIWIKGSLNIENSAQVKLAASYGSKSEVIIADNPSNRSSSSEVEVENSAVISGSGTAGSYLLLISRNNSAETGGGNTAITLKNTGTASIYYAPHGKASVQNSAVVKEITAWKLEIKNSATVIYETGLQNVNFTSGPPGGGSYDIQYWKKVE